MNTNAEPRAATRGRKWFSRSNRLLLAGIVAAMAALSLVAQVALAGPPSPTGVPDQITARRRQQGVPDRSRGRRPDLHVQRLHVEFRRAAGEPVRRQRQADHHPLRRPDLAGEGRQQGRRHGRGQGHPRPVPPFPGCSCPQRRLRGPTVTGSWTRPSSSGSTPPVASQPPAADCNAATAGTVVEVPVHGRVRLLEAHRCLTPGQKDRARWAGGRVVRPPARFLPPLVREHLAHLPRLPVDAVHPGRGSSRVSFGRLCGYS